VEFHGRFFSEGLERERERELLTSIHSPTESASCLSHSLTLFLSIPSPPLFLSIPSPPLSPSSSYACFCPTTGCCCCCRLVTTITHSLTLRNTRNSAAWTIAIAIPPPNITKTIAAIQQQHHLLSSPQHTDINIDSSITIDIYTQYQYRATRRSLAPLNPCSPLSILLTLSRLHRAPPPATTQALSLSLHIAACPPIVCLLACLLNLAGVVVESAAATAATSNLVLLLLPRLLQIHQNPALLFLSAKQTAATTANSSAQTICSFLPYMTPAWQASSTRPGHNALLPDHCLLVDARRTPLTSPALSTNSYLHSPTLQKTLATPCSPLYSAAPGASNILPSEPGPTRQPPAMTPPADQPDIAAEMGFNNDMNVIVGGALQPIPDQQHPQRSVAKAGPGLRLPSFEAMGIASPRPDYFPPVADAAIAGAARDRALSLGSRSHSHPGRVEMPPFPTPDIGDAPGLDRTQSPKACLQPQQNPVHQYVATLTPPAETGDPSWRPSIMTAVMDSPNMESQSATPSSHDEPSNQSISAASDAMQNITISGPATTGERAWLEGAVQALREYHAESRNVNNRLTPVQS